MESIEGIVNGSTNYILTKTANENISYENVLIVAQQKGYAESNPILDTGGFDAKYKLLILIAHAEKTNDGTIKAFVIPKFIHSSDNLYNVDDVFNGIKTKSFFSDVQFFSGKGAGAYPTASAVLSDISALSYRYQYEYKKLNQTETLKAEDNIILKVFLRFEISFADEFKQHFESIQESYSNQDYGYIIGNISLSNIRNISDRKNTKTSFVLFEIAQSILKNNLTPEIQEYEFSN